MITCLELNDFTCCPQLLLLFLTVVFSFSTHVHTHTPRQEEVAEFLGIWRFMRFSLHNTWICFLLCVVFLFFTYLVDAIHLYDIAKTGFLPRLAMTCAAVIIGVKTVLQEGSSMCQFKLSFHILPLEQVNHLPASSCIA